MYTTKETKIPMIERAVFLGWLIKLSTKKAMINATQAKITAIVNSIAKDHPDATIEKIIKLALKNL